MASKRFNDKFQTITVGGSTATLTASGSSPAYITCGGLQVVLTSSLTATLSGLTAGTTYMVYLVTPAAPQLVISPNNNSVGPTGFSYWSLVGGFLATSATTGATIKSIHGAPTTDWTGYTPAMKEVATDRSSEWTTLTGNFKMEGDSILITWNGIRNGSASAGAGGNFYLGLPANLALSGTPSAPIGYVFTSGSASIQYSVQDAGSAGFWFISVYGASPLGYSTANYPASSTWGISAKGGITGWSSTPLINR